MALRRLHRRHGRPEAVDAARPVTATPRAVSAFGQSAARSRRGLTTARSASLSRDNVRTYGKRDDGTRERHTLSSLTHMGRDVVLCTQCRLRLRASCARMQNLTPDWSVVFLRAVLSCASCVGRAGGGRAGWGRLAFFYFAPPRVPRVARARVYRWRTRYTVRPYTGHRAETEYRACPCVFSTTAHSD